ncbi:MAG TPA: hypothetical protein VEL07_09185 [Planctomycetota bacterium]|nr:hypothetical protein [Planctomycetota bacterium]
MTPEALAATQAAYFGATGLWPLVHLRSFQAVTGPKHDRWLVLTVGALVCAVAAALALAAVDGVGRSDLVLAVGAALALLLVDVVFTARRVIARIYLGDAAIEAALIGAWLAV